MKSLSFLEAYGLVSCGAAVMRRVSVAAEQEGGTATRLLRRSRGLARGPGSYRSPLPSLPYNSRYCSSSRPCLFLPKQALLCLPPFPPIGRSGEFICFSLKKKKKKGRGNTKLPAWIEPPRPHPYAIPSRKYAFLLTTNDLRS